MGSYQLCLGIIASGIGFVLRPADVFCAKAKRQRQMFFVRKRSGNNTTLVTQAFSQDVKLLA